MKENEDKLIKLSEENKILKDLLRQSIVGLCSYRAIKGRCAECNNLHYCIPRKLIPKIEKTLNIKNDGTIFKL